MSIVTFFKTTSARRKTEEDLTLEELADRIRTAHARTKTQLPWLKLAQFGEELSANGSLRHDANVLTVTGGEIDYDGEQVTLDEAERALRAAGIECLLYTSPSNRSDAPRWRVLFFFSEPLPPDQRVRHVAVVNEVLGGIAAPESLRLSQAYYYGRVTGSPEVEVRIVRGRRADLCGRIEVDNPFTRAARAVRGTVDVEDRLQHMAYQSRNPENRIHDTQLSVTASLLSAGVEEDEVVRVVIEATRAAAPAGWNWTKEEKKVRGMCRTWAARLAVERQAAVGQVIDLDSARAAMRDWTDELQFKRGRHRDLKPIHRNAFLFLTNHDAWRGVLGYCDFSMRIRVLKAPPWEEEASNWKERSWTDADDLRTLDWFHKIRLEISVATCSMAVIDAANQNRFHPVREYLERIEWDGVPRLDKWTHTYLGSESSSYSRAVGKNSLVAAVARIYQPGCKADTVLILEGPQGTLKSTSMRTLFEPWFTDDIADFGSKDAAMQMRGAWCVEVSELDAMSRGEVSKVKAFITRQEDRFRPPYGKHVIESPRQCVFMGTSNTDQYLRDETGNRRFWPLKTARVDVESLSRDRDQLWAEARHEYRAGSKWWITDEETLRTAEQEQAERYVADAWEDVVMAYLSGGGITEASVGQILWEALNVDPEDQSQMQQNRVARILKQRGWTRFKKREAGSYSWRYRKSSLEESGNGSEARDPFSTHAARVQKFLDSGDF